jgi:hypothetical protein
MAELSVIDPNTLITSLSNGPVSIPRDLSSLRAYELPTRRKYDIVIFINGHGELHGPLNSQTAFKLPNDMQLTLLAYAKLGKCSYDVWPNLYQDLHRLLKDEDISQLNLRKLRDSLWERRLTTSEKMKETGIKKFGDDYLDHLAGGWNIYTDCMERIYTPDPKFVPNGTPYHLFEILYDEQGEFTDKVPPDFDLYKYMNKRKATGSISRSRLLYMLASIGYKNVLLIDISCAASTDDTGMSEEELQVIREKYLPSPETIEAVLNGNWDVVIAEKSKGRGGLAGGKRKSRRKLRKSRRKFSRTSMP